MYNFYALQIVISLSRRNNNCRITKKKNWIKHYNRYGRFVTYLKNGYRTTHGHVRYSTLPPPPVLPVPLVCKGARVAAASVKPSSRTEMKRKLHQFDFLRFAFSSWSKIFQKQFSTPFLWNSILSWTRYVCASGAAIDRGRSSSSCRHIVCV